MMDEKKSSSDALQWMYNEFIGSDPDQIASYQEERIKAEIARQAYDLREKAGLTQKELAGLVGATPAEIDDLEEADYEGDALAILVQIASVLNKKIEVHFVTSNATDSTGLSA